MINPLTDAYASLIKFGLVLTLVLSLYGTYKYKMHEAVQKANTVSELRHKDEILAQKEILFTKKRSAEKELEKDFSKREGIYNEKIKNLTLARDNLFASLQSRPTRPVSTSGNNTSPRAEASPAGAYSSELFREDAESLVNFARDAEEVRLGLIQCYSDYQAVKTSIESFTDKK